MPLQSPSWSGDLDATGPKSPAGWDPTAPSRRRQGLPPSASVNRGLGRTVFDHIGQHVSPSRAHARTVRLFQKSDGPVSQAQPGPARNLFELDLDMIDCR